MLGHLGALVPDQGLTQLVGQRRDRGGDRVADSLSTVSGERRAVLDPGLVVSGHRRQVQQHDEPGGALDQCPDRRTAQTEDEVAFPVPGNGAVFDLGGPCADHDLGADELLAPAPGACSGDAQRPPSPQARDQVATQRAPALHVERLVDGLVRDPHGVIIGEVDPEPVRDLLRAPRGRPAAVRAAPMPATDPPDRRAGHRRAVRGHDRAREPVLHVLPQRIVGGELGHLRAPGTPIGVHWAVVARYSRPPPRVAALRRSSREMVDGDRPSRRAISRTPQPRACRTAISSRSTKDRKRPDSGAGLTVGIPPPSRNQRVPTAGDTPATTADSSLDKPPAIASQNRCRCTRRATGGRPGEHIAGRSARSARRRPLTPIATPHHRDVATTP
jgi:hypothetical protein